MTIATLVLYALAGFMAIEAVGFFNKVAKLTRPELYTPAMDHPVAQLTTGLLWPLVAALMLVEKIMEISYE